MARRQVHLGEHAAHAAAAEVLDGRNLDCQHIAVLFEAAPLRVHRVIARPWWTARSASIRAARARARCPRTPASVRSEISTISRPPAPSVSQHRIARTPFGDRLGAQHGEAGADRQHHVGVIHRPACVVDGLECHQVVVELLRELAQHIEIGARRDVRVGDDAADDRAPGCRCPRGTDRDPRGGTNPRCA